MAETVRRYVAAKHVPSPDYDDAGNLTGTDAPDAGPLRYTDPAAVLAAFSTYIVGDPVDGEARMFCPVCEDPDTSRSPSAGINPAKGFWNCLKNDHGGSIVNLAADLGIVVESPTEATVAAAPIADAERVALERQSDPEAWHRRLTKNPQRLEWLLSKKGLKPEILEAACIGWDGRSYTEPARIAADQPWLQVKSIRYSADGEKTVTQTKGARSMLLWQEWLDEYPDLPVLLCEGGWDALLAQQEAKGLYVAITGTGGAGTPPRDLSRLAGRTVHIAYDADRPGRDGALKVADLIRQAGGQPSILDLTTLGLPSSDDHGKDISDYFLGGGTAEALAAEMDRLESAPPFDPDDIDEGDAGMADLLYWHTRGDLRVVGKTPKGWMQWELSRWVLSEHPYNDVLRDAVAPLVPVIIRLRTEAKRLRSLDKNDPAAYELEREARRLEWYWVGARKSRRVSDSTKYFSGDRRAQLLGKVDAHPNLVNFRNGTFDWDTWELRSADRDDLLTKMIDHDYNPDSVSPLWDRFIETVLPDAEHRAFLQEFIGYSLFGHMAAKTAVLLYGPSDTGKTTLQEVLRKVWGDYGSALPKEAIFYKGDRANQALAKLQGARLAVASEVGLGRDLNEEAFKAFTSAEVLSARFLYGQFFEFTSEFKIMISTNTIPSIPQDDATWGRWAIIPFEHQFARGSKDRNETLQDSLVGEAEGIVAWAMRGAQRVRDRAVDPTLDKGLLIPASLLKIRDSHRNDQDIVREFLDGHYVMDDEARSLSKSELYAHFDQWCRDNRTPFDRRPPKSGPTSFGARVKAILHAEYPDVKVDRLSPGRNHEFWYGIASPGIKRKVSR